MARKGRLRGVWRGKDGNHHPPHQRALPCTSHGGANRRCRRFESPATWDNFAATRTGLPQHSPYPILHIKSHEIDEWLRKLGGAPRTGNSTPTSICTFFSLAKSASYLPKNEETEIFTLEQMKTIRAGQAKTASRRIIPISDNLSAVTMQSKTQ